MNDFHNCMTPRTSCLHHQPDSLASWLHQSTAPNTTLSPRLATRRPPPESGHGSIGARRAQPNPQAPQTRTRNTQEEAMAQHMRGQTQLSMAGHAQRQHKARHRDVHGEAASAAILNARLPHAGTTTRCVNAALRATMGKCHQDVETCPQYATHTITHSTCPTHVRYHTQTHAQVASLLEPQ